jgi:hypothetical protein
MQKRGQCRGQEPARRFVRSGRSCPRILHRAARAGLLVRPGEPVAQQVSRLGRRAAVKRHQRGGHAGNADDVRTPAVTRDRLRFDEVRASPDELLEAMNVVGHGCRRVDDCEGTIELYAALGGDQAKRVTKTSAQLGSAAFSSEGRETLFLCPSVNRKFTKHPQFLHRRDAMARLDRAWFAHYACNFMLGRLSAAAILAAAVCLTARPVVAAEDATLLRVFLTDGTSLVSYGEPARVGDRVIFSMPTSAAPNPPLHLVNLPAERVNWDRTNRYAAAARESHYVATQAETDYATVSNEVALTLSEVAATEDPAKRLEIVERARKTLADWPQQHFNYRQGDVRQMLGMLDEAIADLRAQTGAGRFELALSTFADPQTITEPLLPPPGPREAIEQMLTAARAVDNSVERTSLLATTLLALDRDKAALPPDFVAGTRAATEAAVQTERRLDRSYRALTDTTVALADRRARLADVRGLERMLLRIHQRDQALGARRPEAVNALVAAVEARLDAARRLRLARDRWALRAPVYARYRMAMRSPMLLLTEIRPPLESIKSLSGSTPTALTTLQRAASRLLKQTSAIAPPEELVAAHALLTSAIQLALNAAEMRREATLANDLDGAWNASSAAAGALMLSARARGDIQALLRPPQLQ